MSSHSIPMWVMPTLVTEGRPGPAGTTGAAGYSMSSMTRSSRPNPTMAAVTTTGDGTSSPMSCSICSALHPVRRRQHTETEDLEYHADGRLHVGDADGGVGEAGQHRLSVGRGCGTALP